MKQKERSRSRQKSLSSNRGLPTGLRGTNINSSKDENSIRVGNEKNTDEGDALITKENVETYNVALGPAFQHLSPDDWDTLPLAVTEIPNYVAVNLGDVYERDRVYLQGKGSNTIFPWSIANEVIGARFVYREHSKTGEFLPVLPGSADSQTAGQDKKDRQRRRDKKRDVTDDDLMPAPLFGPPSANTPNNHNNSNNSENEISRMYLILFIKILFVLVQGVLAGFSATSVISEAIASSDSLLLTHYTPYADETRRYFYLLSTVSLVGAMDTFLDLFLSATRAAKGRRSGGAGSQSTGKPSSRRDSRRTSLAAAHISLNTLVIGLLCVTGFAVAFLMSLGAGVQDTLISQHDGYKSASDSLNNAWIQRALKDPFFSTGMTSWRIMVTVRFGASCLGWICSCLLLYLDNCQKYLTHTQSKKIVHLLRDWKRHAGELQGDHRAILHMNETTLHELSLTLQMGLERVQDAMASLREGA